VTPCFRYLISGGDPAILLSDELPEDDTELAVKELRTISEGKESVLLIAITCGLSAPYAAGMLDFAMDVHEGTVDEKHAGAHPNYYAVAMGFNPVELSRSAPIEMWKDRPEGRCKTFLEVAERLHKLEQTSDQFCMLNPVVGPEPVAASSRMKGGSVTKIMLDATFALAAQTSLGIEPFSSSQPSVEPPTKKVKGSDVSSGEGGEAVLERILQAFETTYRETYSDGQQQEGQQRQLAGLATVLQKCGDAVINAGHVYYVGDGCAGDKHTCMYTHSLSYTSPTLAHTQVLWALSTRARCLTRTAVHLTRSVRL
jgi:hypothetical protein